MNTSFNGASKTAETTKKKNKKREAGLRVVYISSPMKVTTSATRFRALVQELTGPHSDVAGLMETCNPADNSWWAAEAEESRLDQAGHRDQSSSSSTANDSLVDGDLFSQIDESFTSMFPSMPSEASLMEFPLKSFESL